MATVEARPVLPAQEKPCLPEKKVEAAESEKKRCSHLDVLESLAREEDFEKLMKQNQKILTDLPKDSAADEILYAMGLLYAHPENPKKNYRTALSFFKRVLKEYPRSFCAGEAKIWAGVLEDIENAAKVDLEIEQKKKELDK